MVTIIVFLVMLVAGISLLKEHSTKLSTVVGVIIAIIGAFGLITLLL